MFKNRSFLVKIIKDDPSGETQEVDVRDVIKDHFSRNKTTYFTLGIVGLAFFIMRKDILASGIPVETSVDVSPIAILSKQTVNAVTVIESGRQGPPSWVVRCKETGDIFMSQRAAAFAKGIDEVNLSKHLNGLQDHANGFTFERICVAA